MKTENSNDRDLSLYDLDHRQGRETGLAAALLQNDALFKEMKKSDWSWSDWSTPTTRVTMGKKDGVMFKTEEQTNVEAIRQWCLRYRKMSEEGVVDPNPLAVAASITRGDDKQSYRWINLPKVIARKISNEYFGGMDWEVLKRDKTLRAQFYMVVEKEYNDFVCFPHGKLPIPIQVAYPKRAGEKNFFSGVDFTRGKK
jgi:hypothetical protein